MKISPWEENNSGNLSLWKQNRGSGYVFPGVRNRTNNVINCCFSEAQTWGHDRECYINPEQRQEDSVGNCKISTTVSQRYGSQDDNSKLHQSLGVLVHICSPCTRTGAEGWQVPGQPALYTETLSKKQMRRREVRGEGLQGGEGREGKKRGKVSRERGKRRKGKGERVCFTNSIWQWLTVYALGSRVGDSKNSTPWWAT